MLLPEKMTDLTLHLAKNGKTQEALILARRLLDRITQEQPDAYHTWRLDHLLERLTPALCACGLPALELLGEVLLNTLGENTQVDDPAQDASYVWRPAIEEHQQNPPSGFRSTRNGLVTALREVAEQVVANDVATPNAVIEIIERFQAPIFLRLVMYLLRRFPASSRERIASYLTTYVFFDELCYRHEYALLAGVGFKLLTPEEQLTILNWSTQTSKRKGVSQTTLQPSGGEGLASSDEAANDEEIPDGRLSQLAPFAHDLPADWKARYEAWVAQYGVPEHPDFVMYFTAGWVNEAPDAVTTEQLQSMSVSQLIEYLETWTPSNSWRGPSREGVGQLLTELINTNPTRFAPDVERFAHLHPTYLAAVFQGFTRALSRGAVFPWNALLSLIERFANGNMQSHTTSMKSTQQGDPQETSDSGGEDVTRAVVEETSVRLEHDDQRSTDSSSASADDDLPLFSWVRQTMAHLLERGLATHPVPIAPELREAVWKALQPLTTDADPTPEVEQRVAMGDMEPTSLAINSVRGLAMHATIFYARWLSLLDTPVSGDDNATTETPLPTLPLAVGAVLDEHLDPVMEQSTAVHSVYGQHFAWLAALDPVWARAHLAAIFSHQEEHQRLYRAAWNTYLLYTNPTRQAWTLLRDEYRWAVERLDTQPLRPDDEGNSEGSPEARLLEHIIELAWSGNLSIDAPDELLARAFASSSDQLLGHVLARVGLRVLHTKGGLKKTIRQRLQNLWRWRMESALASDALAHPQELMAFGWWFGSGSFPDRWAVAQLKTVLTLTKGHITGAHVVLEQLAKMPTASSGEAIACLDLLLDGDQTSEYIAVWESQIGDVLSAVGERGEPEARTAAIQLINRLVARGVHGFRAQLVKLTVSQPPFSAAE